MESSPEKTREPYSPTNTPNPPQDIDPSRLPEKNNDSSSLRSGKQKRSKTSISNPGKKAKTKKLGDNENEINNETTH